MKYSELLKQNSFNKILLFTFEDKDIINEINVNFVFRDLTILSKAEIIGKKVSEIIKLTQKDKYDLLILSNRNSQLNRTDISLKLLALFSNSKKQLILYSDNKAESYTKLSLLFNIIPDIVTGSLIGLYLLIKTFFFFLFNSPNRTQKTVKAEAHKTIAFLRTDLAGKVTAGGSISHIRGFINGAKESGFSTIYLSDYSNIPDCQNIDIKQNDKLGFFDELQLIDYHFRVIKEVKKLFRENPPALIYQRHSVFNASGAIIAKHFNVPLILEVNSSEVWVKKNWSRLVLENIAVRFENFAFKSADTIGVVSEIISEEIVKLGADKNKIVLNPNGVDPNIFSPDLTGNKVREKFRVGENILIGFIGTFTKWHGVEILFNAAKRILSSTMNIKFIFIGEGNLKIQLEEESKNLKGKENIIFTGLIPHNQAPEYLAACDILVSPHLGFETGTKFFGSPTKLFEYMAMGKAIIASDLEQIGEIINDNINGLKTKPGDVDELISKILLLANNPELRARLGKQARADVEKFYTWKMNTERVLLKVTEKD